MKPRACNTRHYQHHQHQQPQQQQYLNPPRNPEMALGQEGGQIRVTTTRQRLHRTNHPRRLLYGVLSLTPPTSPSSTLARHIVKVLCRARVLLRCCRRRPFSSHAAGLIVKLISSDPSTPVHPPVQAIVTEVDAQGRVQALELAVLRAFDSASSPIELVAESGPLPVRRTSNAKSRPHESRCGLFGPHTHAAAAAAFPSSPSPSSPVSSTQPSTGTLRVKLDAFTPYAALFKARAPCKR